MKKEWLRHYVLAFAFLFILITSILILVFKINLVGFVTLIDATYCDQTKTSNYYDLTGTVDCAFPSSNGALFNANNVELNCQSNTITSSDNSAGYGMRISGANANFTVRSCRMTNFAVNNIEFVAANNTVIRDSNISGAGTNDLNFSANSNNNTLLNVTFTKILVGTGSNYTRQWYLDIYVNYSNGTPLNAATVVAFNSTSANFSGTTNSNGYARLNATRYINISGTPTFFNIYNVTATDGTNKDENSSVVVNSNTILQLNVSVSTDSTPPSVTILNPQNITYATSSIPFNFTLNEAGACNYSLNNGATNNTMTANASNTGFNATNVSIADGGYTARAYCIDNAGNRNGSESVVFSKDTTPPAVTIISPTAKNYSTSSIEFNVSTNENSSCLYSLNSGLNNITMTRNATDTGFNATNSSIADGQYIARFYCNDTAGNWNRTETRAFGIDTIKPAINLTYPLNTSYAVNVSWLNYTTSDTNLQACWWSSNNGVNNVTITCGTNITGANSSEGNNTWLVSVNDSAGNVNFSRVTFVKDTTAPILALVSPPDGHNTTDTSMIFSYNITDTSNITNCSLIVNNAVDQTSSSVAKNSQQNFSRVVSAASYTWNVNCTDTLNNIGNSTTRSLTINAQPSPSNTSGGGSGGSSCLPKWQCSEWTECENGNQTRTCTDLKRCVFNAQIEKRACVVVNVTNTTAALIETERVGYCRENWTCRWKACRSGWQDAYNCTDINRCGTNAFEPVNRTCTEREFPLPNIPLVPAATVGGSIVIIGLFVWWWLLLLAAIPFFMRRLRHYCLSLIDFDNLLKLDKDENRQRFISLLKQHVRLENAGSRGTIERFLLERGFFEIRFDKPCIINTHFFSMKDVKRFKEILVNTIKRSKAWLALSTHHEKELINDINLVVEKTSIFAAVRAAIREKRARKVIREAIAENKSTQ